MTHSGIGGQASPTAWTYNGNHYYIMGGIDGNISCKDALTGDEKWKITEQGGNRGDIVVNGEYMMCYTSGEHKAHSSQNVGMYRITDNSYAFLWEHPETTPNNSPPGVIVNGYAYKNIESQNRLYCFDAETGDVISSVSAGISSHYLYYVDGKIFTETDAQHPSSNSIVVYSAQPDSIHSLTGWDYSFTGN